MLEKLKITDFQACLGQVFDTQSGETDLPLTLQEVTQLGQSVRDGGAFSLLFVGPEQPMLDQSIYRLNNPALGEMELFLVPVGPAEDGMGYESVFT